MRITPENITSLAENEIFVFGSNLEGIHGRGAAKLARERFGARYGIGQGMTGRCYALPTKGYNIETLSLAKIYDQVHELRLCVLSMPLNIFLVTEIGCGLAGYSPGQIAPLFDFAIPDNMALPASFWKILLTGARG